MEEAGLAGAEPAGPMSGKCRPPGFFSGGRAGGRSGGWAAAPEGALEGVSFLGSYVTMPLSGFRLDYHTIIWHKCQHVYIKILLKIYTRLRKRPPEKVIFQVAGAVRIELPKIFCDLVGGFIMASVLFQ